MDLHNDREDPFSEGYLQADSRKGIVPRFCLSVLFIFSICMGVWIGTRLPNIIDRVTAAIRPTATPSPTPIIDQRTLLIIGVDRIPKLPETDSLSEEINVSKAARLQSIWLAIYFIDRPGVNLIPLYPQAQQSSAEEDEQLETSFAIDSSGNPHQEFLDMIEERTFWNHYVMLDDIVLITIIDLVGGIDLGDGVMAGPIAIGEIPYPWEDRQAASEAQQLVLEELCKSVNPQAISVNFESIFDLIPQHLVTDVNIDDAIEDWLYVVSSGPDLDCRFPTLEMDDPYP